jgi:hypothetical protein
MKANARKCWLLGLAVALSAQIPKLEFEAASARALGPVAPGPAQIARTTGGPGTDDPERTAYTHVPMQQLITTAFNDRV